MVDYAKYPEGNRYYTGAERKKSLIVKGVPYLVKFRKNSREGLRFNHVSEYLGSHIFNLLGVQAQETFLGRYGEERVVAIRDFLEEEEVFIPFNGVGDSTLEQDKERYQYTYQDIIEMLHDNMKLTDVQETVSCFWDMFIIDALLANFDRHGSNWGFIKKDNRYRIAPVFDNGSSLFPQLNTDEKLLKVLESGDEMEQRIFKFPTSQIKYHGQKSSYYDIIKSRAFSECNQALVRIVERIDFTKIDALIDSVEELSDIHRLFYKTMLRERYDKILYDPYLELKRL